MQISLEPPPKMATVKLAITTDGLWWGNQMLDILGTGRETPFFLWFKKQWSKTR